MGLYGVQAVPTGKCVHFIDEVPAIEEVEELARELQAKQIKVVYVDCFRYLEQTFEIANAVGYAIGTEHPPYDEQGEVNWVRWSDDLWTLGHASPGLVVVLDNAEALFVQNRKFLTDLLESFLHAHLSWSKRDAPFHLCFQMAETKVLKIVFDNQGCS